MKSQTPMRIDAPSGTLVSGIFDEKDELCNGFDWQKEHASKHIKPRVIYEVERTIIHGWSTEVFLKEFPNVAFNSVHFYEA